MPKSGSELLLCNAEVVHDWQDVGDMVEGYGGHGVEHATHLVNGIILGDLQGACEGFLGIPSKPQGGAICKGGEDDGRKHTPPVGVQDPTDRVPQNSKGGNHGLGTGGKGGDVLFPGELIIQKDAQVLHSV